MLFEIKILNCAQDGLHPERKTQRARVYARHVDKARSGGGIGRHNGLKIRCL